MVQRFQVETDEDASRDELLVVLVLVFLVVRIDAIIGVGLGKKAKPLRHPPLLRSIRPPEMAERGDRRDSDDRAEGT